jgi:hypothetical protein
MDIKKALAMSLRNLLSEQSVHGRSEINIETLPLILYHVTTNYHKVISSGVLLAKSGLDSGGLGGTESMGVSFVTNRKIAEAIYDELNLLNRINGSNTENEVISVLNTIQDSERRDFVLTEYMRTIDVYKRPDYAALMALRLSRNSSKFNDRAFHGLVIFHEENIKNKDIGVIEIDKNRIASNTPILPGVDTYLGEIRVLGDVYLR